MKLRIYPGLVFALILTICLAGPFPANAFSLFNRNVKKAKEFMAAGMYPQAIELLQIPDRGSTKRQVQRH